MVKRSETVTARLQRAQLDGVLPAREGLAQRLRKDAAHASKTNYADRSIDADRPGAK